MKFVKGPDGRLTPAVQTRQAERSALSTLTTAPKSLVPSVIFDANIPVTPRDYHYDGLIPIPYFCLWAGAKKAEKSLFALRKAMHDACGKDWLSYQNLLGPMEVIYFDAENAPEDVHERFAEIITEFDESEQSLIRKNLHLVLGKKLKNENISFEYTNTAFWKELTAAYPNARAVYLDCWYQLHDIKPSDNEKLKKALESLKSYFKNAVLHILHHTGAESTESLLKKNPMWLRFIGPDRWSNKIYGGKVLLKDAEIVICQEKYTPRDEQGLITDEKIDFMVYARNSESSPLISFENDYGNDETEYKFRRRMIRTLDGYSTSMLARLNGKGPWSSTTAIFKDTGMSRNGRAYRTIADLVLKGYIGKTNGVFHVNEKTATFLDRFAGSPEAEISASDFLSQTLAGLPDGMPRDAVVVLAQQVHVSETALQRAKARLEVVTLENGNWVLKPVTPKPKATRKQKAQAAEVGY
jgi:hypothetical protein